MFLSKNCKIFASILNHLKPLPATQTFKLLSLQQNCYDISTRKVAINYQNISLSLVKYTCLDLSQNPQNLPKLVDFINLPAVRKLTYGDIMRIKYLVQKQLLKQNQPLIHRFASAASLLHIDGVHKMLNSTPHFTKQQKAKLTLQNFFLDSKREIKIVQNRDKSYERVYAVCVDSKLTSATGRGAGSHHGGILIHIVKDKSDENSNPKLYIELTELGKKIYNSIRMH